MDYLIGLIDELDPIFTGSIQEVHNEIFDFIFGNLTKRIYEESEVWIVLSDSGREKYSLNGNIKLNRKNCKMYNFDPGTKIITMDISVNGRPGLYEFSPGEYVASVTHTDIGFVDVSKVLIHDIYNTVAFNYYSLVGIELIPPSENSEISDVPESPKDRIEEIQGNVIKVNFGKKQ